MLFSTELDKPEFPWVFECMRNGDLLALDPHKKKNQTDLQPHVKQYYTIVYHNFL